MLNNKIDGVKVTFNKVNFETFKSDALFLWTSQDLIKGDKLFIEIHKEAGNSVNKDVLHKLNKYGVESDSNMRDKELQLGTCVTTKGGMLNCETIFHCTCPDKSIKPQFNNRLNILFSTLSYSFNIVNALNEERPIRKVTFTTLPTPLFGEITSKELTLFYRELIKVVKQYSINEVEFIGLEESDIVLYKTVFEKEFYTIWDSLYHKIFVE